MPDRRYRDLIRQTLPVLQQHFAGMRKSVDQKGLRRVVVRKEHDAVDVDFISGQTDPDGGSHSVDNWLIDSARNIAFNTLLALVTRDDPRDVADLPAISRRYVFNWSDLVDEAQAKSRFTRLQQLQRCRMFPLASLDEIDVETPRDSERDASDRQQLSHDIENISENRICEADAEPLKH